MKKSIGSSQHAGFGALVALMFVSGTLAVAYEVTWARMLGVAAGHGVLTSAVVVATFMAGLGLGSWLSERRAVQARHPLSVYAAAELAVAAFALAFPLLAQVVDPLVTSAYRAGASSASLGLQLAWAGALLLVPTTLMGLTLPTLARLMPDRSGTRVASLYAANSFGGAFGALAAVFVLLPRFGHATTVHALAAAGFALACATRALAAAVAQVDAANPRQTREAAAAAAVPRHAREAAAGAAGLRRALALAVLTGFCGLALEGVWTRALVLFLGSSTHALALILGVFIAGLAAGGVIARVLLEGLDDAHAPRVAAALTALTAIAAAASGPMLARVPAWMAALTGAELGDFGWTCGAQMRAVSAVTLPSTLLLGVLWPLAVRLAGGRAGAVGAANTCGAVAGTLAVPLALLPALGLAGSLAIVAALLAAGAAALWSPKDWLPRMVLVGGAGLVLVAAVPPFDPALLNCGPLMAGNGLQHLARSSGRSLAETVAEGGRILFHREGAAATVAVREVAGHTRTLLINGKPDASSYGDLSTQRLLAHLPLALAPDAADVLVIGLGAGVTAGSVLAHPVKRVTVAEVSPEVVAASRYFHPASGAPLDDPRTRLVVADGRTHVERCADAYDVITSEPTNPWISGVGALFTREFFTACRARLKHDGVMAQWLQAYGLPDGDFASVVQTFRSVFPQATLWRSVDGADYLLIGRTAPGAIAVSEMRRALARPAVRADLAPIRVTDELDLLGRFVCGPKGLALLAGDARLQCDDRLDLEFARPSVMLEPASADLRRRLAECAEPVLDHLSVESSPGLVAALTLRQSRDTALRLLGQGQLEGAADLIAQIEAACADQKLDATFLKTVHLSAIDLLIAGSQLVEAGGLLEGLVARYPADPDYAGRLAALWQRSGNAAAARATWARLLALAPGCPDAHRGLAAMDEAEGDRTAALGHWRAVQQALPRDPAAATAVVRLLAAAGQKAEARRALQMAVAADPGLEPTFTSDPDLAVR